MRLWLIGRAVNQAHIEELVDDTGAPMGVQQKLMRHADISTTAKYGDALMESKRKHNSIVVRRALGNE